MLTQAGFEPPTKLLVKGQGREGGGGEKMLKTLVHRSFINSNYSSITTQKLFTKET